MTTSRTLGPGETRGVGPWARLSRVATPDRGRAGHRLNFLRGRAAVARLAHNQEVVGSNPARATSFRDVARICGVRIGPAAVPAHRRPNLLVSEFLRRAQPGSHASHDGSKSYGLPRPLCVVAFHVQQHGEAAWKVLGGRGTEIFAENGT